MTKGSCRQQVRAVRKCRPEHGSEIAIVDRELAGQAVIERNVLLGIKAHGLVIGGIFDPVVNLFRFVIHSDKSVAQRKLACAVRVEKIHFLMRSQPRMIQVGRSAALPIVKNRNERAIIIPVCVETAQAPVVVRHAGQAVDAAVVSVSASEQPAVIRAARRIGQRPEVIIERVVFLHNHNHMFYFLQVAVGIGRLRRQ
jgi:hypothetical protein